jgi:hypothetical protein
MTPVSKGEREPTRGINAETITIYPSSLMPKKLAILGREDLIRLS